MYYGDGNSPNITKVTIDGKQVQCNTFPGSENWKKLYKGSIMGKRNTIIYDTVAELEEFIKTVELPSMCLPADKPLQFAKGYVTFVLREDNTEVEESEVWHVAPMFDGSLEECKEINYQSTDAFLKARDNFLADHETTAMWPCDDPKRLLLGFTVHPQREWHNIKIKLLNENAASQAINTSKGRAEAFTKGNREDKS